MSDSKTQLIIDLGELASLENQLAQAQQSLEGLTNSAAALEGEVGHGGLAGKVRDFASSWDNHRADIVTNLGTLRAELAAIIKAVVEADSSLAAALTQGTD